VTSPEVYETAADLARATVAWRAVGQSIALVPTMGALHDGHLALVERAGNLADRVVVSIFVNPLQFGGGEDFDRYPRDLDKDLQQLSGHPVDGVFVPGVEDIYPDWPDTTPTHSAGPLGEQFEGAVRPGHFDGVLTVVSRLFDLVDCDLAVFGQKDAQQVFLVEQMARHSHPQVTVETVDTVRAPSGLALSSRNSYLDEAGRVLAQSVSEVVRAVSDALSSNPTSYTTGPEVEALLESSRARLPEGVSCEYLDVVTQATFSPFRGDAAGDVVVISACRVQSVRLIDAVRVSRPGRRDD
jgi:pantoate--beta-alanine ligase